jgi:hypothetical protein
MMCAQTCDGVRFTSCRAPSDALRAVFDRFVRNGVGARNLLNSAVISLAVAIKVKWVASIFRTCHDIGARARACM